MYSKPALRMLYIALYHVNSRPIYGHYFQQHNVQNGNSVAKRVTLMCIKSHSRVSCFARIPLH